MNALKRITILTACAGVILPSGKEVTVNRNRWSMCRTLGLAVVFAFFGLALSTAEGVGQAGPAGGGAGYEPMSSERPVAVDRHATSSPARAYPHSDGARLGQDPETSARGGHDHCFECFKWNNYKTAQGWLCSEGPEHCHWHGDETSSFENYWLNDHPQEVWLDDECHNVCEPEIDPLLFAANELSAVILERPGELSEAIVELAAGGIDVRWKAEGAILVVAGSRACPQEFVVPVRSATEQGGAAPEAISPIPGMTEDPYD